MQKGMGFWSRRWSVSGLSCSILPWDSKRNAGYGLDARTAVILRFGVVHGEGVVASRSRRGNSLAGLCGLVGDQKRATSDEAAGDGVTTPYENGSVRNNFDNIHVIPGTVPVTLSAFDIE